MLLEPKSNFLAGLEPAQYKVFHSRFVNVIMATDMARHMEELNMLKNKVKTLGITAEANNGNLLIDQKDSTTIFKSQQTLLDMI